MDEPLKLNENDQTTQGQVLSVTWVTRKIPGKVASIDYVCLPFLAKVTLGRVVSYRKPEQVRTSFLGRSLNTKEQSQRLRRSCLTLHVGCCELRSFAFLLGCADPGDTQGKVTVCVYSHRAGVGRPLHRGFESCF